MSNVTVVASRLALELKREKPSSQSSLMGLCLHDTLMSELKLRNPEKALLFAVFYRALQDYWIIVRGVGTKKHLQQNGFDDEDGCVVKWFLDENEDEFYSFGRICKIFEFDKYEILNKLGLYN